jgi:hypothetical protein
VGICKKFKGFSIVTLLILAAALTGCNKDQAASDVNGNPANGNLAAVNPSSSEQSYAPATGASYNSPQYEDNSYYQPPVQVTQPPPPLPVYEQPPCPGPDYVWTPGYWGYGFAGYYWVPGAWVLAPYGTRPFGALTSASMAASTTAAAIQAVAILAPIGTMAICSITAR